MLALPLSGSVAVAGRCSRLAWAASTAAGAASVRSHNLLRFPLLLQHQNQQQQLPVSLLFQQQQQQRCMGHLVRVILREDLEEGKKGRARDVLVVAAGYARNYLIPQKKALYATPENLKKLAAANEALGVTYEEDDETYLLLTAKKPPKVSIAIKRQRKSPVAQPVTDEVGAADRLLYYLRNKHLKMYRNINPITRAIHPGMVDAAAVRQKFAKQLRITLTDDEMLHLSPTPIVPYEEDWRVPGYLESVMETIPTDQPCTVQIRQLGVYAAKITLSGGYVIPLVVHVFKR